jgi:hypothetical protein
MLKRTLAREAARRMELEEEAEALSNAYVRSTDREAEWAVSKADFLQKEGGYKAKLAAAEVRRTCCAAE